MKVSNYNLYYIIVYLLNEFPFNDKYLVVIGNILKQSN